MTGTHDAEAEALERLFELYEQKMYRVAFSILHDEGQAEDAVMAAFEKVVRQGGLRQPPESDDAKRLMVSYIKSTSIDIYRKKRREREVLGTLAGLGEAGDATCASGVECSFGAGSMSGAARMPDAPSASELLEPLPSSYRAVLHERFVNEKTVRETADTLHISESNVRKRQQRALAMLRESQSIA